MLSQKTHPPVFNKIQEGKGEAYLPVLTEHFPHSQVTFQFEIHDFSSKAFCYVVLCVRAGLSLRAGGRRFSPATKRVAPGYFYWKIEEK